ncbi:MAG: N-6 DNA methylase [Bacteroidales bacterium]|jgi:type I restriction-modification system DNA methylase subunit|nr:N-6 DNA methylase [Bacteroidales bacterium]
MASLQKIYNEEKLGGVVYTPQNIVCRILDAISYSSFDILGKKIIDPSCGDGRFLMEVVRRIIKFSPKEFLKYNLEQVYGWDISPKAVESCKENLNSLIDNENLNINWNIFVKDSIKEYEKPDLYSKENTEKFDFIASNPPYIRIQHLSGEQRKYIQQNYTFCQSGSTDIYIAFYELCLNLLSDDGICGLITPNTFFHTQSAKFLRQHFVLNKNLLQIINFGDIQLFDDATTYSAITIFNKKANKDFVYKKAITENKFEKRNIKFSELKEPFWQLSTNEEKTIKGEKLKNLCDIHVGITTLCDKAYIFPITNIDDNYVYAHTLLMGKIKIEKDILKPIIKVSKLKHSSEEIKEYVLFPYKKVEGKNRIIDEKELKEMFPLAYNYLISVKPFLDKRDNGKTNPVSWYAFGRSQGLDTSFGEKIVFSPMNLHPNFIYCNNSEATFYSGYCIKTNKIDVNKLISQLNSQRMEDFVFISSRDFRNGWKAYNKKVIENFEVVI